MNDTMLTDCLSYEKELTSSLNLALDDLAFQRSQADFSAKKAFSTACPKRRKLYWKLQTLQYARCDELEVKVAQGWADLNAVQSSIYQIQEVAIGNLTIN